MDLAKIGLQLDKVRQIYDYLNELKAPPADLDRDVLLQAIRELYAECLLAPTPIPVAPPQPEPVKQTPPQEQPQPEPVKPTEKKTSVLFTHVTEDLNQPEVQSEKKAQPVEQPPVQEIKKPVEQPPAVVVEKPQPVEQPPVQEIKKNVEQPPAVEKNVEQPPVIIAAEKPELLRSEPVKETPPAAVEQPVEDKTPPVAEYNPEYDELFVFQAATDLSQKLGEKPIADLDKSISVGDKFLYMNQLFNGDAAAFKTCRDILQDLKSMDQARLRLERDYIGRFGWMEKNRKSAARDFIKLVRRLYL